MLQKVKQQKNSANIDEKNISNKNNQISTKSNTTM